MLPIDAARAFVDAINSRNVDRLAEQMTEDHLFIDSLGDRLRGRAEMKAGWTAYYRMVPDYAVTIAEEFAHGDIVMMFGTAQGTYAGQLWQTPVAFRAVVRDGLIAEWRVYGDNEPIRKLIREHTKT